MAKMCFVCLFCDEEKLMNQHHKQIRMAGCHVGRADVSDPKFECRPPAISTFFTSEDESLAELAATRARTNVSITFLVSPDGCRLPMRQSEQFSGDPECDLKKRAEDFCAVELRPRDHIAPSRPDEASRVLVDL